jgi:hypothetical protein
VSDQRKGTMRHALHTCPIETIADPSPRTCALHLLDVVEHERPPTPLAFNDSQRATEVPLVEPLPQDWNTSRREHKS